jgi:hypothetical protein
MTPSGRDVDLLDMANFVAGWMARMFPAVAAELEFRTFYLIHYSPSSCQNKGLGPARIRHKPTDRQHVHLSSNWPRLGLSPFNGLKLHLGLSISLGCG